MDLIVDASVAIKWFVQEDLHQEAMALCDGRFTFQAPDLILAEVANIAWKKVVRGEIDVPQAQAIGRDIGTSLRRIHPSTVLVGRALDVAMVLQHPVYDCLYLACAEATGAVLVTADRRFKEALAGTVFDGLVWRLEDAATLATGIH